MARNLKIGITFVVAAAGVILLLSRVAGGKEELEHLLTGDILNVTKGEIGQRMLVFDDMEPSEKVRVYDKGVDLNVDAHDDQTRRKILISYRTGDMYAPRLDRTEALAGVVTEVIK